MSSAHDREALEAALVANPDDRATHAAYADWLTEHGDPRGEFIQVQLALEDEAVPREQRQEWQRREKELLDQHQRDWLGDLAPCLLDQEGVDERQRKRGEIFEFQFRRGWLSSLQVTHLDVRFARLLCRAPQLRLIERLLIHTHAFEEVGEYERGDDHPADSVGPSVHAILRCPFLGNVRVFQLGSPMDAEPNDEGSSSCHMDGETAADLVARMPRLEELRLLAHRVDLNRLFALPGLKHLRILQVYHINRRYPLELLADNSSLGNLTDLLLFPHWLEPGDDAAYLDLAGFRAVVRSPHLRSLRHLHFRASNIGDEGCEEIVASGVLRKLKILDLMHGRIGDAGARRLADCPDLRNLDVLQLSYNQLTAVGVAALQATGVPLLATSQHPPGDDENQEYLWVGDME